jgi:hypothetical protein
MTRKPSFAVLRYSPPICEDDVMMPTVVRRFETFEAAEAFRAHRFGAADENSTVMED